MPTIEKRVAASYDDGCSKPTEYYIPTNMDMFCGGVIADGKEVRGWFRFLDIIIPNGSTITVAYIRWYFKVSGSPTSRLYADDQANPGYPTSAVDNFGRTRTTNYTQWNHAYKGSFSWENSPSIVSVIQELVDSYDYSSGAAIQILHVDNNSTAGEYFDGRTWDWTLGAEPVGTYAAYLHIEYEVPAKAVPSRELLVNAII